MTNNYKTRSNFVRQEQRGRGQRGRGQRGPHTYLPEVNLPYEYPLDTYLYYPQSIDSKSYFKLLELVEEMLSNDCWAATVEPAVTGYPNSEVIFNAYNPYSSYRTMILDEMVHSEMLENPCSILEPMITKNKDVKLRLYMGYTKPWTMNVWYKAKSKVFQISFLQMY
jgi:hypothetical protein